MTTVFRKPGRYNPGDKKLVPHEGRLDKVEFTRHKLSGRERPGKDKTVVISCFSEFGCETLAAMYCIPAIKKRHPDSYFIASGWHGREYLYRHLVDEFWELGENAQWLRDYCVAFHHKSKNLANVTKALANEGTLIDSEYLGRLAVGNLCNHCGYCWGQIEDVICCPNCTSKDLHLSLFGNLKHSFERATRIPDPSPQMMERARARLPANSVGVTARGRVTYGRNLPPEYYVGVVARLRARGYEPVWLGEKQNAQPCPVPDVLDMTQRPESRDLELTLAMVKQMRFTVQYWTASTRLAGMMGTPYLIFESPDQLFGGGQEAYRMTLCTFGNRKVVLCNYANVMEDQPRALDLLDQSVTQMEAGDWSDVIGIVEDPDKVAEQRAKNLKRLKV
jgi:hypothetical protein